jgi:hypothetical protein
MSPAEFDAYQKRYEEMEQFGDRWAEAQPVGGAPIGDEAELHAAHAWDQYMKNRARGMDLDKAAGWTGVSEAESGGNYRKHQNPGPAYGYLQWERPRREQFEKLFGFPMEQATEDEQLQFRDWELANTHTGARDKIDRAAGPGDTAAAITEYYEAPDKKRRERFKRERAAIAEAVARRARLVEQGARGNR